VVLAAAARRLVFRRTRKTIAPRLRQTRAGRKPIQPRVGSAMMGMEATLRATATTKRRLSRTRSRSSSS
jgi:hypothetical protein